MAEQNGGGLLDELMGAVEGMLGDGDQHAAASKKGGGLMEEVASAVGSDKFNELKDDITSGNIDEMKKDVGDVINQVIGDGKKKDAHKTKATSQEAEGADGGILDSVMDKVKGEAAKAVGNELKDEVGGLLKGLLGGDK